MIKASTQLDAITGFEKPWGNYLLEKIVETQTPETISWWPQTIAWQLLLAIAVIFLLRKGFIAFKNYQKDYYRREALQWLKQCKLDSGESLYHQLPQLLRKTALVAFKRSEITQLSGKSWDSWLDKQCSKTSFSTLCPNLLYQVAFANSGDIKSKQYQVLIKQVELWVRHHRRQDD